jgi:hypothetical protein
VTGDDESENDESEEEEDEAASGCAPANPKPSNPASCVLVGAAGAATLLASTRVS